MIEKTKKKLIKKKEVSPEQWKIDVNDRYQKTAGLVISLSTASLVLPIFFLKNILAIGGDKAIIDVVDKYVYWGWGLLGASIFSGILYLFFSAKWVKLSWKKEADIFWIPVNDKWTEHLLDWTYFMMMCGFLGGISCMLKYMATYVIASPPGV